LPVFLNNNAIEIKGNFYWKKGKFDEEDDDDYKKKKEKKKEKEKVKTEKEKEAEDILILKNIDMKIEKGKLIGVLGKVGSGKSTILNSLLCETKVHSGDITNIQIAGDISYVS
jgi:ABC-type polysaccharide/polyol phosphate transport system ATPase subunit